MPMSRNVLAALARAIVALDEVSIFLRDGNPEYRAVRRIRHQMMGMLRSNKMLMPTMLSTRIRQMTKLEIEEDGFENDSIPPLFIPNDFTEDRKAIDVPIGEYFLDNFNRVCVRLAYFEHEIARGLDIVLALEVDSIHLRHVEKTSVVKVKVGTPTNSDILNEVRESNKGLFV